jgi:DNA-binding NtrC family response regulator
LRVIVLDETLDVSCRARDVLSPLGAQITFAGSLNELSLVCTPARRDDLLIINVTGNLAGWETAAHLRRHPFDGRVVAIVDDSPSRDAAYLREVRGVTCVKRPGSAPLLDALLLRLAAEGGVQRGNGGSAGPSSKFHNIVARSKPMLDIFSRIEKVAAGDANVCIYGESGTGKELIARAIHDASARRERPFVTLDCTAIPEGTVESQLFGHVKGSFTGAVDHHEGLFSVAHTGTLFIDELCELSLPLQAKLLRVVQTREFVKVGGTKPVRSNIRLITATNRDPKREVDNGNFREDLYYRVAVVMIKVPPLRDRREDIPLLVDHFLGAFATVYNKQIRGVTPAAMERLVSMPWPGNVRQLENFLAQAVVMAEGEILTERDLFVDDPDTGAGGQSGHMQLEPGLSLREVERRYILRTLQRVKGNRTEAARVLGISIRCLQYKLKAYVEDTKTPPVAAMKMSASVRAIIGPPAPARPRAPSASA